MIVYYVYIGLLFLIATVCKLRPFSKCSTEAKIRDRKKHTIVLSADKNTFIVISSIMLFVLIAFRDISVGTDTRKYYYLYNSLDNINFNGSFTDFIRGEYGYKVTIYLLKHLGVNWLGFQVIYALVVSFATGLFISQYSEDVLNSTILFITVGSFSMALTGIRQTLAISLMLIAFMKADKKKWFSFIAYYLLATSIHYTSIVFILVLLPIFLIKEEKEKTSFWLAVGLAIPIFVNLFTVDILKSLNSLMLVKYEFSGYYSNLNRSLNPIVFVMYWTMFIFVFICLLINRESCTKKSLVFYLLASAFISCYEASRTVYMINRLSHNFAFFFIVSVSNAIGYLPINSKSKRIVSIVISLLSVLAFAISTPGSSYGIDQYIFWRQ